MANNEKTKILQMIEEGKITVDEAIQLLDALKPEFERQNEFEERISRFSNSAETFARDFGNKIEDTFKEMEPRVKKATKTVIAKTASIVDELSKALNESLNNLDHCDTQEETQQSKCCGEENCDCKENNDDEPKSN